MFVRLLIIAVAGVTLAACGTSSELPSKAEEAAYAESPPPVDEPVEYRAYTHCGVESLHLGGRWWTAVEPLYGDDGPGSAPAGWDDPYQAGTLTLESEQSVTFEAEGKRLKFVPADDDRPLRVCR